MHLSKMDEVDFLIKNYPDKKFLLMSTGGIEAVSCFVCWVEDSEELEEYWSKISSLIAVEYQSQLESEFSTWNIYLVFVCKSSVSRSLRYKIENDRFSMRKIVLEHANSGEDEIIEFMNNEIFCKNLDLMSNANDNVVLIEKNSEFREFVLQLGEIPSTQNESSAQIRLEKLQKVMEWNRREN